MIAVQVTTPEHWPRSAASAKSLFPDGLDFDDAPVCFEASSVNGWLVFASRQRLKVGCDDRTQEGTKQTHQLIPLFTCETNFR